jgi:hypothetical protein
MEIKKAGFIERQLLRLLKPGRGTSSSVTLKEEEPQDSTPGTVLPYNGRARKALLIMLEQKKAQGLVSWEKRRYPY